VGGGGRNEVGGVREGRYRAYHQARSGKPDLGGAVQGSHDMIILAASHWFTHAMMVRPSEYSDRPRSTQVDGI